MDLHSHQSLTFQSCQASDDTHIFPTQPLRTPPPQDHNLAETTREKRALLQLYFLKCTRAQISLQFRTASLSFCHAIIIYHSLHCSTHHALCSCSALTFRFTLCLKSMFGWNLSSRYQWPRFSAPSPAGCSPPLWMGLQHTEDPSLSHHKHSPT